MPNWGFKLLGAVALALLMAVSPASAASLKVFYAFHDGEDSVGVRPVRGVVSDSGGLYGTAVGSPSGTLFRIDVASAAGDLLYPVPITASGVSLYGLPAFRRDNLYLSAFDPTTMIYGIYRIADGGTAKPKPIHEFIGPVTDGKVPNGFLLLNGSYLYGATDGGGSANIHDYIFKMDLQGNIIWKSYLSAFDGSRPIGQLVKVDGWLYGATNSGGPGQLGTVFRVKASTGESELLHSFGSQEGGQFPGAGLTYLDGYLYGVTSAGGAGKGGTVFRLKKGGGDFTVLYSFTDKRRDGFVPFSPLLPFSPGGGEPVALYGTTAGGGSHGDGTIYKITPEGTKTTLVNFVKAKGSGPEGSWVSVDGVLYGTAPLGGPYGKGTLFAFTP